MAIGIKALAWYGLDSWSMTGGVPAGSLFSASFIPHGKHGFRLIHALLLDVQNSDSMR